MAKLPDVVVEVRSKGGICQTFNFILTVSPDGVFAMRSPDELWPLVRTELIAVEDKTNENGVFFNRSNRKGSEDSICCKLKQPLVDFVTVCAKKFLEPEESKELVIVYMADHGFKFLLAGGIPYLNGEESQKNGHEYDYTQWKESTLNIATSNSAENGMTGALLKVSVFEKTTFKRGSSETYSYDCPRLKGWDTKLDSLAQMRSWSGQEMEGRAYGAKGVVGNQGKDGHVIKFSPYFEMPATEENAAFFYDYLNALRMLAYKASEFFADPVQLQARIASGDIALLNMKKPDNE